MVYSSHLWYVVGIVHNWVYRWPFTTHPHSWVFLDIYPEQDREVSAPEASQIMKLHNYCTYNWWLWLYNLFWWFYNLFWLAQLAHWNFHVGIAMDGTCLQNILLPPWSLGIIMQFMAISIEHYMKTWNHQGDNDYSGVLTEMVDMWIWYLYYIWYYIYIYTGVCINGGTPKWIVLLIENPYYIYIYKSIVYSL